MKTTGKKRKPTGWAEVGARIKSLREERRISRETIAHFTSIDAVSLFRIEKGEQWVSPLALRELSEQIGVPVKEFFAVQEASNHLRASDYGLELGDVKAPSLKRLLLALASLDDSDVRRYLSQIAAETAAAASTDNGPLKSPKKTPKDGGV